MSAAGASHAVVTLHRLQVYSASLLLGVPAAPAAAPAGALAAASAPAGSGLPAASAPATGPYQRYPSAAGRAGGARLGASPAAAPAPGTILTVMGVACQLPFYFRGAATSRARTAWTWRATSGAARPGSRGSTPTSRAGWTSGRTTRRSAPGPPCGARLRHGPDAVG